MCVYIYIYIYIYIHTHITQYIKLNKCSLSLHKNYMQLNWSCQKKFKAQMSEQQKLNCKKKGTDTHSGGGGDVAVTLCFVQKKIQMPIKTVKDYIAWTLIRHSIPGVPFFNPTCCYIFCCTLVFYEELITSLNLIFFFALHLFHVFIWCSYSSCFVCLCLCVCLF